MKENIVSMFIRNNNKFKKYKEFKLMTSVNIENPLEVKVVDFIFNEDGSLRKISSELSKEETKEVLNRLIDNNYEQYCK